MALCDQNSCFTAYCSFTRSLAPVSKCCVFDPSCLSKGNLSIFEANTDKSKQWARNGLFFFHPYTREPFLSFLLCFFFCQSLLLESIRQNLCTRSTREHWTLFKVLSRWPNPCMGMKWTGIEKVASRWIASKLKYNNLDQWMGWST